jgi:hypothetical protein
MYVVYSDRERVISAILLHTRVIGISAQVRGMIVLANLHNHVVCTTHVVTTVDIAMGIVIAAPIIIRSTLWDQDICELSFTWRQ